MNPIPARILAFLVLFITVSAFTSTDCLAQTVEICDNGIDDDGDGAIDCADPDLANDCCCLGDEIILPSEYNICDGIGGILFGETDATVTQWYFQGDLIPGATATTLQVDVSGIYTIVANGGAVCETEASTTVIVSPSSVRTEQYFLCEGDSIVVNDIAYGATGVYSVIDSTGEECMSIFNFEILMTTVVTLQDTFNICGGESVTIAGMTYSTAGDFTLNFPTVDTPCDTIYNFTINLLHTEQIEKTFQLDNEPIVLNGVTYDMAGQYFQSLPTPSGCDTICIINIISDACLVSYNFDNCYSSVTLGAHDYSEFTADYINPLMCGDLVAASFQRINPDTNRHSCTEGLDGTNAICISSEEGCEFRPSSEKAGRIAMAFRAEAGREIILSRMSFMQKAPEMFSWSHATGPNNYPTKFGVSIVLDGVEVYRADEMETSQDWSLVELNLGQDVIVSADMGLEIQILGYCLIGNGSTVSALDLEDIKIYGSCRPAAQQRLLAGTIALRGQIMEGVEINSVSLDNFRTTMTDNEGIYAFGNNSELAPYALSATMDANHLNGISTIDLIMIQRHILGITLLTSPLDLIAADVNKSGNIDGIDLAELRKLILGIYTELPQNDSYRFFDKYSAQTAVTVDELSEIIEVEQASKHLVDLDFVGVKIGDLNQSAIARIAETPLPTRDSKTVNFEIEDKTVREGSVISIPVYAEQIDGLVGLQTNLKFNPEELQYIGLAGRAIDLTDANLGMTAVKEGSISISWNALESVTIDHKEALFELEFEVLETGQLSNLLSIDNAQLSEVYGSNLAAMQLDLAYKSSTSTAFEVYQNKPNPFATSTDIGFSLPAASDVTLRVFDINGKVILKKRNKYEGGIHSILVDSKELAANGLLYYTIETAYGTATMKMINIQ